LRPVEEIIKGKRRLLIAPDGPLYYLPFECLLMQPVRTDHPDFSKLPYIVRDFEVQYIPSASVLASMLSEKRLSAGKPAQKELLAFADPSLSAESGKNTSSTVRSWVGTLTQLPYTRTEVEGIASLYPTESVSVFVGNEATEKKLKQTDLEIYRRLHFASHGLIDEDKPEFSALVLSPDKEDSEDGFLTMREVFELKMNADLVVLSACKTGLGKTIRGEGVSGLSRAFLSSGAQNVLVSLWNVYDLSTATFMKDFYREMEQKDADKLKGLKDARVLMIQSGKYSHPYYWAPFVLVGSD
jgi:CHAT domain-containing protein